MGRPIKKGSTDQSTVIKIIDSTTGLPENAVEHDSPGIDLWYRREQETKTSITEAALATLDAAHSDGGIELIGDGYYRLDLPDAACAVGAGKNGVMVGGTVTGMIVIGCYIPLVDYDPYDSVRAGLTALPNAAADGAGGLPISDAGELDLDTLLAYLDATISSRLAPAGTLATVTDVTNDVGITQAGADKVWGTAARTLTSFGTLVSDIWGAGTRTLTGFSTTLALAVWDVLETAITTASSIGLKLKTNLDAAITSRQASGSVDLNADQSGVTIGTCNTNTDMVGTDGANTTTPPTVTEIQTEMEEDGDSLLDTIRDELANETDGLSALKTLLDAIPTTAMRGTENAALASVCTEARLAELAAANLPADVDGIKGKTVNLPADPASETNIDANETKIDSLQTDITAIKAKTDNQPAGIPKNVALSKFPFLMIDSTDHLTPKTGLTVTAQTNKDGAGFTGSTNNVVEVASGWYEIDWTQAEMNFDIAAWKFTASGADQRDITVKTST